MSERSRAASVAAMFLAGWFFTGGCQSGPRREGAERYRSLGYVVVTPHGPWDGGDFGPHTAGTKTSGLQEAFDYAKREKRDLFISGGAQYILKETLHIPWRHSFRCDGGEYNILYKKTTGDAVWIDSQMNVFIKLGSVYAKATNGAAVRMKPATIGPDGFAVITASRFEFNYLIAGGDPWGVSNGRQQGISLFLDGEPGCITNNRIYALETSGSEKGLYMRKDCFNNLVEIDFVHLCNTQIQLGDAEYPGVSFNRIETVVVDGDTLGESIGAQIFGHNNVLTLNIANASPGQGIIFEPTARNNIVETLHLAGGVTNRATTANNQVVSTHGVGLQVETPAFPASGQEAVNRSSRTVEIIILTPGKVSDWTITENNAEEEVVYNPLREVGQPMSGETYGVIKPKTVSNSPRAYHDPLWMKQQEKETEQTITGGLFAGQCIVLDAGDRIRFQYAEAPSWRWKALR